MTNAFQMTIEADRGEIARVNAAFAELAERHALPAAVRRSVSVVLDELLTNTIVHGFAGRPGQVTVDVELQADRVCVEVTDDGPPFSPLDVRPPPPDARLSVEQRPVGGLGIHLIRQMMDDVRYERRDGRRNVVTLAKRWIGGR